MPDQKGQQAATEPKDTMAITVTPDMVVGNYDLKVDLAQSMPKAEPGPNEYRCDSCGNVYEKAWTDEEAQAEYEADFPTSSKIDTSPAVVCDDCYKLMIAWKSPARHEAEVTATESTDDLNDTGVSNPANHKKEKS